MDNLCPTPSTFLISFSTLPCAGVTFHADFLLGLLFDPEDSGYMIVVNGDWLSGDYTALYPRRYCHVYEVRVTYKTGFWIG
jgi:hypothetical protein